MRWKCVAVLVTVVAVTSGQYVSIDHDINAIATSDSSTATPKPTAETFPVTIKPVVPYEQLRDIPVTENINSISNKDDNDGQLDENYTSRDNDGNENNSVIQETELQPEDIDPGIRDGTDDEDTDDTVTDTDDDENDQNDDFVDTTEAPQTTGSGQENENDDDTNGSLPGSNESGGEQSVETGQPNSNENVVSRSIEYESSEGLELIETEGGSVQGSYLHGDTNIRSYIDIPYGAFSGLFSAPTKAALWDDVLDNKEHLKRCPQIDENGEYVGSIDCLTLTVFTPKDVENAPVLFHIYDGDFNIGSADPSIYGPEYLVTKGIILVLPNYRLGALGFLCLNNDTAPGNAGLKDLTLALEWTRNNIENFGGDPLKIVVSGDGRSGALAGYLALSQTSRQYLSGVITESGSIFAPWAIDRNPDISASLLRDAIQSNITNELEPEVLVTAAKDISFRPCIEKGDIDNDNVFMNETPWQILHNEAAHINISFIIGSANHAGLQEAMTHTTESLSELNENFHTFLPDDLKFKNGEDKDVAEKIKKLYFGDNELGLEQIEHFSLCYTDAYYLGPSIRASRALVGAGAKVYFYEFSFVGNLNRMLAGLSSTVQGAARGDIVGYTFTQDGEVAEQGSNEESVVDLITDLWVSFLHTGEPLDSGAWNHLEKVADSEEPYLSIAGEALQKTGLHEERLALWTQVYDNHFVETNLAVEIQSSLYLIVTGTLLLILRKF